MNRKGFTLVELLTVVAIVAVIGGGVAVTYGRDLLERSKRQMTLHEMGEIRDAFERFHADNVVQIRDGVDLPGTTTPLPTARFCATFTGSDTPLAATSTTRDRVYGEMEFFERFGLWPLLQSSISWKDHRSSSDFIVFNKPDLTSGDGWQGPYLEAGTRQSCEEDATALVLKVSADPQNSTDPLFPQIATRYTNRDLTTSNTKDFYRVIYFEHCEDWADANEPVYRRLILFAAENPADWDTWDELKVFTGNRRGGSSSRSDADYAFPLDLETGAIKTTDSERGLFFVELLNLDRMTH